MATWILFLHLLFPSAPTGAAPSADDEAGPRYRGIEALFARFEAEAAAEVGAAE